MSSPAQNKYGLRERKPANHLHAAMPNGIKSSGLSSGAATPVPKDAPPSVLATSSAKKERRAEQRKRIFPTVDYEHRVSHFDPRSDNNQFWGFFVLFWIGLAIMVFTTMLRNLKESGYPFTFKQREIFTANIYELIVSDASMSATTAICLPLNIVYKDGRGLLRWNKAGVWIQATFQISWAVFWIYWPFLRDWTWTAQVFFTLHLMVLFMKMHSYGFYNGHLATTLQRLNSLDKPSSETDQRAVVHYPSSHASLQEISKEQHQMDREVSIDKLREDLAYELVSPMGQVTYPQNLTLANFFDFLCCPTLCYEIEYPRIEKRSLMEIFYKSLAVFGCVFLLTVISEEYIIPELDQSAALLRKQHNLADKALIFAETVSRLLFPFMITFLLVFLAIFEYLCGAFAEITGFADRQFFSSWWNTSSGSWLTFSRDWNIPVHNFFRRHVYSVSRTTMSRPAATFITFFISSAAHEVLMGCITRKFRGYGFFAMMMQIPIVSIQTAPFMKDRVLLNNVLFWCSMILGLSTMCALYVLV